MAHRSSHFNVAKRKTGEYTVTMEPHNDGIKFLMFCQGVSTAPTIVSANKASGQNRWDVQVSNQDGTRVNRSFNMMAIAAN